MYTYTASPRRGVYTFTAAQSVGLCKAPRRARACTVRDWPQQLNRRAWHATHGIERTQTPEHSKRRSPQNRRDVVLKGRASLMRAMAALLASWGAFQPVFDRQTQSATARLGCRVPRPGLPKCTPLCCGSIRARRRAQCQENRSVLVTSLLCATGSGRSKSSTNPHTLIMLSPGQNLRPDARTRHCLG